MSHCKGCGGVFRHGHPENFDHILGCGWIDDETDDNRHAPSQRGKQRRIIIDGLEAAGLDGATPAQAELFIAKVIEELDAYQT